VLTTVHLIRDDSPLAIAYVDLMAAVASINRNVLWTLLLAESLPLIVDLLHELCTDTLSAVRVDGKWFHLFDGVRNAYTMARDLFLSHIDRIIHYTVPMVMTINTLGSETFADLDYAAVLRRTDQRPLSAIIRDSRRLRFFGHCRQVRARQ